MLRLLPTKHIDNALGPWRSLDCARPRGGWLRAIRQALGMTTRQLARNVRVSRASVSEAERAESRSDITLTTLRRHAAALDCELVYVLLPGVHWKGCY